MTTDPITVSTIYVHNVTAERVAVNVLPGKTWASIHAGPVGLFVDDLDAAIAIGEAIVRQARKLKAEAAQAAAPFVSDETADIARVVPTAVVP